MRPAEATPWLAGIGLAAPRTNKAGTISAGRDCLMGVQLGGKVIWAGLLGCGCGAGTGEQQREAVTVLP